MPHPGQMSQVRRPGRFAMLAPNSPKPAWCMTFWRCGVSDDERSARESGDGEYKPYGALLVTVVLAAVIIGFWALLFVLSLLRT